MLGRGQDTSLFDFRNKMPLPQTARTHFTADLTQIPVSPSQPAHETLGVKGSECAQPSREEKAGHMPRSCRQFWPHCPDAVYPPLLTPGTPKTFWYYHSVVWSKQHHQHDFFLLICKPYRFSTQQVECSQEHLM